MCWRPGQLLGDAGGLQGGSWGALGAAWGSPGLSWGSPGRSWAPLGSSRRGLGGPGGSPGGAWDPPWRHFRARMAPPSPFKKHGNSVRFYTFLSEEGVLGTPLGITWRPWGDLGLRAGVLGGSWATLGGSRAAPGVSWGRPGVLLGRFEAPRRRSRAFQEPQGDPELKTITRTAECAKPSVLVLDSFRQVRARRFQVRSFSQKV